MLFALSQSWPSAIAVTVTLASGIVVLLAACHDIASRTVPNWMPVSIACLGVVAAYIGDRLLISVGLGLVVFIGAAICWRRGWLGGADVKLLGAIAVVLPLGVVSMFAIAMSLAGAVHAIAYMVGRRIVTPPPPLGTPLASPLASPQAPPLVSPLPPLPAPRLVQPLSFSPTAHGPRRRALVSRVLRAERWRISRGGPLPYACAIAFGFLFVICNGGAP